MRFRFWKTASRALADVAGKPLLALRIAGPWLLLCVVLQLGLTHLQDALNIAGAPWWQRVAFEIAEPLLTLLCGSVAAITWHQRLASWERPQPGDRYERLRRTARYALVSAAILLVPLLPLTLAPYAFHAVARYAVTELIKDISAQAEAKDESGAQKSTDEIDAPRQVAPAPTEPLEGADEAEASADEPETDDDESGEETIWDEMAESPEMIVVYAAGVLLTLAVLSVLLFVPARWSLALPAIATGRLENPLRRAWHFGQNNSLPLIAGILLALAIAAGAQGIALAVLRAGGMYSGPVTLVQQAAIQFALTAATFLGGLFWLSFLTHADGELTGRSPLNMSWRGRRIPFWATLRRAHASVLTHWRQAAALLVPALAVFCVVIILLSSWRFDATGGQITPLGSAISLATEIVGLILGSLVAVKWHRLILLGEMPSWRRWPPHILPYLAAAFVVWACIALPIFATGHVMETVSPTDPQDDSNPFSGGVPGVLTLVLLVLVLTPMAAVLSYLPLRFSLALPALAIGVLPSPLARSWELSRGNFWRLFWASLLCYAVPIGLFFAGLVTGAHEPKSRVPFVLLDVVTYGTSFAFALIWIGFLSHAYRALTTQTGS